jgi:hypothetical protein
MTEVWVRLALAGVLLCAAGSAELAQGHNPLKWFGMTKMGADFAAFAVAILGAAMIALAAVVAVTGG